MHTFTSSVTQSILSVFLAVLALFLPIYFLWEIFEAAVLHRSWASFCSSGRFFSSSFLKVGIVSHIHSDFQGDLKRLTASTLTMKTRLYEYTKGEPFQRDLPKCASGNSILHKEKLGFLQHLLHLPAMCGTKIKLRNQALNPRLELGLVVKQSGWSAL